MALGFYKSRTGEWAILRPVELPEDAVSVEGMVTAVSGDTGENTPSVRWGPPPGWNPIPWREERLG